MRSDLYAMAGTAITRRRKRRYRLTRLGLLSVLLLTIGASLFLKVHLLDPIARNVALTEKRYQLIKQGIDPNQVTQND
jgi:hypothetical protein